MNTSNRSIIRNTFYIQLTAFILLSLSSSVGAMIDGVVIGQFLGVDSIAAFGIINPLMIAGLARDPVHLRPQAQQHTCQNIVYRGQPLPLRKATGRPVAFLKGLFRPSAPMKCIKNEYFPANMQYFNGVYLSCFEPNRRPVGDSLPKLLTILKTASCQGGLFCLPSCY